LIYVPLYQATLSIIIMVSYILQRGDSYLIFQIKTLNLKAVLSMFIQNVSIHGHYNTNLGRFVSLLFEVFS
jgi:hypothetical protein